jgi:hypothetical protein
METVTIDNIRELQHFISDIQRYSRVSTNVYITGELYGHLAKTFEAYGRYRVAAATARTSAAGQAVTAIFTFGLSEVVRSMVNSGGSGAAEMAALSTFQTTAYADEVFELANNHQDEVKRNDGVSLLLG